MKRKPMFLIIVIALVGVATLAFAQRRGFGKLFGKGAKSEVTYLAAKDLDGATMIVYATTSGALPPEYYYNCILTVEPTRVRLKVSGYNAEKLRYDQTFEISEEQWQQTKESLLEMKVGNKRHFEPLCGGKGGSLEVYGPDKVRFSAIASEGLVYEGRLSNAFVLLLPEGEPRQVLQDPSIVLKESAEE